jgi:Holliday junction resolvase-like predicted endonuclease
VQERQPGEQIVHEGLGAVGVIGITPSASAEAGEVDGIAKVDALVRVVAVEESQERFAGLGVDV